MNLSTLETGDKNAPAILFLHGGGLSRRMWEPQLERLTDFHCLAPDLPEHGESRSIAPFTLEDSARRVAELIREYVPGGKVSLVGLSLGGAVALTLLSQVPELVESAMVTGTAARISKTLERVGAASLWMLRLYTPQKLVEATAKQMGIPNQYRSLFDDDLLHTQTEEFTRRLYHELAIMELPEKLDVPLLTVVGGKETAAARDAARKLVRLYPTARGFTVPRYGHVWNLQIPELFSDTVRAWINGQPLPTGLQPL